MLNFFKKNVFLTVSGLLAFTACGEDGNGSKADAAVTAIDAKVEFPDAKPSTTFSGTISLAEVAVSNPVAALAGGLSGAVVNVSYTSPGDVTVPPQEGYTNNIGACRVFVYDVKGGESAPKGSDGGVVSVTKTGFKGFDCAFNADKDEYLCSISDAAAKGALPAGTTVQPRVGFPGQVFLTIPNADFSNWSYKGMWINLSGFAEGDAANDSFAILANQTNNVLIIASSSITSLRTIGETAGKYGTFVGEGPIPGGYTNFLDNGTQEIEITKPDATDSPAVSVKLKANGDGFLLADESTQPHAFPTNGDPVTFSCEGIVEVEGEDVDMGGNCGTANGTLKGIVVFGETTDGVLSENPQKFTEMPDPVNSYATWQCSGIGAEKITLDAGALALILGTNPTRIQTSVVYSNALTGSTNVLASHGVVGWTDVSTNEN